MRQAIYTTTLVLGLLVGGLCGGYIVAARGLVWIQWVNVIPSAILFALVFLFEPETMYSRRSAVQDHHENNLEVDEKGGISTVENRPSTDSSFAPSTFARSLRIGICRPGLGKRFVAPVLTLRLPGVWLIALWYSGLVGGVIAA